MAETSIGRALRAGSRAWWVAVGVTAASLVLDVRWVVSGRVSYVPDRMLLAGSALLLLWLVCERDACSLGLTVRTRQGARWWWRATALTVLVMGVVLGVVVVAILAFGGEMEVRTRDPAQLGDWLWITCFVGPVVEEVLYRVVLVVPLAAVLRPGWVVLLAGLAFAGVHVFYGNVAPNHLLAGIVMTWAFLKSGSVLVPLLWHAGGNLLVVAVHVTGHYLA